MSELLHHHDRSNAPATGSGTCSGDPISETAVPLAEHGGPQFGSMAGRAAVAVAGLGLGLVAAHAVSIPTPPCPLRSATNFPCPFCGMTHVARNLIEGHVGLVARHDPAGLVLAAALGVVVVAQVTAMIRRTDGPAFMSSRTLGIVLLVVLAAHWGTTIVTGGMLTA